MNRAWLVGTMVALLAMGGAAQAQQGGELDLSQMMQGIAQMAAAASNAMAQVSTNLPALVDGRELKALLPDSLPNLKRKSAKSGRGGMGGLGASYAEAIFADENDVSISVKITDAGGLSAMMALALAADIDEESDDGTIERTVNYGKYRAMERYDGESKEGEITVNVNGRIVEVEGENVSLDTLRSIVKKINLDKLAGLKAAAPKPSEP